MKSAASIKKLIRDNKNFLKRIYEEVRNTKTIRRASYKELHSVLYAVKYVADGKVPLTKKTWEIINSQKKKFDTFIEHFQDNQKFSILVENSSQKEKEEFLFKHLKLIKLLLSAYFIHGSKSIG